MYKVQFLSAHKPGTSYVESYATAKRAKQVVANVNAQEAKDNSGVTAKYLGAALHRAAREYDALSSSMVKKLDPREPDPTREGIFREHNCWKCDSGKKDCVVSNPRNCEYPHARND